MAEPNDPRVFFAAERTLVAWNRTSLALMAFGFVIERFGLFVRLLLARSGAPLQRGLSFWMGIAFILLGAAAALAIVQYRGVLGSLRPGDIPAGRLTHLGAFINLAVALLGVALSAYLFYGTPPA